MKELESLSKDLRKKMVVLETQLQTAKDTPRLIPLAQEYADLKRKLALTEKLLRLRKEIKAHQQIITEKEKEPELAKIAEQELPALEASCRELKQQLTGIQKERLAPEAVLLEIRAGAGGNEAALFAGNLLRMYNRFAEKRGWRVEVMDISKTDLGGVREAALLITGQDAAKELAFESGVHRVQRIPQTEKQGRIHTSTASVAVLPKEEDVKIEINPTDLKIDTFHASGKGGQHVNVTDSAIRITHLPTNIVVTCQNERSQHKNREKALSVLKTKLHHLMRQRNVKELAQLRREQIGGQERSEKIRTYNFPQDRVTDHRLKKTWHNLEAILDGDLEKITSVLREKAANKLSAGLKSGPAR